MKLKLGQQIGETTTTTNSKPPEPIIMMRQSENQKVTDPRSQIISITFVYAGAQRYYDCAFYQPPQKCALMLMQNHFP
jgi:hypothetical protein